MPATPVPVASAVKQFAYRAIWVDFKVFGSLGMTLLFMLGQGLSLYRYVQEPQTKDLKE
ncbi:hypothetical protein DN824_14950 [Stutzerimonas nosocomialis]|nr:hypothetical protein DN824_14950 [Stutzerimonas nosocomialis]